MQFPSRGLPPSVHCEVSRCFCNPLSLPPFPTFWAFFFALLYLVLHLTVCVALLVSSPLLVVWLCACGARRVAFLPLSLSPYACVCAFVCIFSLLSPSLSDCARVVLIAWPPSLPRTVCIVCCSTCLSSFRGFLTLCARVSDYVSLLPGCILQCSSKTIIFSSISLSLHVGQILSLSQLPFSLRACNSGC